MALTNGDTLRLGTRTLRVRSHRLPHWSRPIWWLEGPRSGVLVYNLTRQGGPGACGHLLHTTTPGNSMRYPKGTGSAYLLEEEGGLRVTNYLDGRWILACHARVCLPCLLARQGLEQLDEDTTEITAMLLKGLGYQVTDLGEVLQAVAIARTLSTPYTTGAPTC